MQRRAQLAGLAVAVAMGAAACGDDDTSAGPAEPKRTPAADAAATATPVATAEPAGAATRGARLVRIGRFDQPVYVTAPPGDRARIVVVEQGGRVWMIRGGRRLPTPFLDVSDRISVGGERGLLSLAFAPDYAQTGRFYVDYTDEAGDTRVVEYRRATPDRADPGSARVVLAQEQPEANHNGGLLLFGPDKLLYVGLGDGGGAGDRHGEHGNGQKLGTLLGKILRIDPRASGGRPYTVPRSNPFLGRSGARGEIYAYGLRNPWRFSFDRATGDLAIGDVGQDEVEEVDFVRRGDGRGANFGWRAFEGNQRYTEGESAPGHVPPVLTRTHAQGWCSITGGVVVRDRAVPSLYGRYVFGDYCMGQIWTARLGIPRAGAVGGTPMKVSAISSFGEDARGRVYVVSLKGPVYRIAAR